MRILILDSLVFWILNVIVIEFDIALRFSTTNE